MFFDKIRSLVVAELFPLNHKVEKVFNDFKREIKKALLHPSMKQFPL